MVMVLICSMPGCQTTAGCRCNRYEALYAKAAADVAYSSEIAKRDAEITRLTAELSALRACEGTDTDTRPRYSMKRMRDEIAKAKEYARAEALEEAARYHDDLEAQHEAAHRHVQSDHHAIMEREHRRHAASIRALMVKP